MIVHVFVLVFLLIFFLALLCALCWPHPGPSKSRAAKVRTAVPRLLKPRCPDDALPVVTPLLPHQLEGQRLLLCAPGARSKAGGERAIRVNTEGFGCPNHLCPSFGITDDQIHALVGDGKHGHVERIQTFRCQACRTTFSARRDTPLYRLKTPSHQIAMVLTALAEGLDPSAASRVFGFRQATITTWIARAGEHAQALHTHYFCSLQLPHVQLDELRTRLRSYKQVVWLWLAIDPCTKILPVLSSSPSHAKSGAYGYPLSPADPSSRLSPTLHQ